LSKPEFMLRRLVSWLQPVVLILSVIAIGWFLSSQWPVLRNYPWRLDGTWFVAAILLTLAGWGLEIGIWRHLLLSLGGKLPYQVAARIWFLSAVVRYIPGNVWQPLSLTLYSRRYGVAPEVTITSLVLFQVITLLAIAPILVIYFLWIDTRSLAAQFIAQLPPGLIWIALLPVVAFLLRPQWLVVLLNWTLARLKRPPLAASLTSPMLLTMIVVTALNWLIWGGAFAALAFALAGDGVAERANFAPLLIASYPIAYVVGFLSLITPSGFGVREGAMFLLLTPQIDGGVVTVIALAMRVWTTLGELVMALISAPFEHASSVAIAADSAASPTAVQPPDAPNYTHQPVDTMLREPVVGPDLGSKSS
jgi:glycosyltransferase 2 family protein